MNLVELKEQQMHDSIQVHRTRLNKAINGRLEEMNSDANTHYLVYRALGIPYQEHPLIDRYQNIGRFVYKYAGALLEELAQIALGGEVIYLDNNVTDQPKRFQIDSYTHLDNKAHEIKWRDATTDGDHRNKENNKIKCILLNGKIPVRVMFFMPERKQARNIQEKIIADFKTQGEAYIGEDAFEYIKNYSNIDLKEILAKEMPELLLDKI